MAPTADQGQALKISDIAQLLNIHERTVRRYIAQGLLDAEVLPGGHYRVSPNAIQECLQAGKTAKARTRPRPKVGVEQPQETTPRRRRPRSPRRPRLSVPAVGVAIDLSDDTLRALAANRA
jgi:excisionase family DNA binding protein